MQAMDYDRMLGKARSQGLKQKDLAKVVGISPTTMSLKIAGRYPFTSDEIRIIVEKLGISPLDIGDYFFTPKVQKTELAAPCKEVNLAYE